LLPFSSALAVLKKNQSKLFIGKDHHESLFSSLEFFFSEAGNHDGNLDSENIISPSVELIVNYLSQLELFLASISIVILLFTLIFSIKKILISSHSLLPYNEMRVQNKNCENSSRLK
jgi:hypothetical protein